MENLNIAFNEYIEEVKKLDIKEKREELIFRMKELLAFIDKISELDNIKLEYLKNNEILDIKNENVSEHDIIEAAIVYIEVAKNALGMYLSKVSKNIS